MILRNRLSASAGHRSPPPPPSLHLTGAVDLKSGRERSMDAKVERAIAHVIRGKVHYPGHRTVTMSCALSPTTNLHHNLQPSIIFPSYITPMALNEIPSDADRKPGAELSPQQRATMMYTFKNSFSSQTRLSREFNCQCHRNTTAVHSSYV